MKKARWSSIFFTSIMIIVLLLSGCKAATQAPPTQVSVQPPPPQETTKPSDTQVPTQIPATPTTPAKPIKIRFMSWHGPDSDTYYYAGYKEATDAYTKLHPNVTFEFVIQPLDGYKELLDTQYISNSAPDIIHMQPWMFMDYANKDVLVNLDPYFYTKSPYSDEPRWIDSFVGGETGFGIAKSSNKYGGIMFVPMDGNPSLAIGQPIMYNKDLFKKAGLDPENPPKTWKDFIEACKKLKAAGITPIAADNGRWIGWSLGMIGGQFGNKYVDQFYDAKYTGKGRIDYFWDKVYLALANGQLETADYYDEMLDLYKEFAQYWQDGWTGTTDADAPNLFLFQEAAMIEIGFWDHAHYKKVINGFEWGLFPVPLITKDTAPHANEAYGQASNQQDYGFVVSKTAGEDPDKLAAIIDFFQYFTSIDAQKKYIETAKSFSPMKGVPIIEELKAYAFPMDKATEGEVVGQAVIEWGDGSIWPGLTQEFLNGKLEKSEYLKRCAELSKKTGIDYATWALSADGYASQITAAKQTLEDMKANKAPDAALAVQEDTIALLELRLEMFKQYYGDKVQ